MGSTMKPMSERAAFRGAIILKAEYWSSPGSTGVCELAVRRTREHVELWQCNDEYGPDKALALPASATWRDIVKRMVGNEIVGSTIYPPDVEILGDDSLVGQVLALAWSADEDNQRIALLLSRLDDRAMAVLATTRFSLHSAGLRTILEDVSKSAWKNDIEIDEVDEVSVRDPGLRAIRSAFRRALAWSLRRRRESDGSVVPASR
jgi:hypothetical protein